MEQRGKALPDSLDSLSVLGADTAVAEPTIFTSTAVMEHAAVVMVGSVCGARRRVKKSFQSPSWIITSLSPVAFLRLAELQVKQFVDIGGKMSSVADL